jgi:hypothetical protein
LIVHSSPNFTALSRAFDPTVIELLLLDPKADVNPGGCVSVLQDACENEKLYVDSVKILLETGVDRPGSKWISRLY